MGTFVRGCCAIVLRTPPPPLLKDKTYTLTAVRPPANCRLTECVANRKSILLSSTVYRENPRGRRGEQRFLIAVIGPFPENASLVILQRQKFLGNIKTYTRTTTNSALAVWQLSRVGKSSSKEDENKGSSNATTFLQRQQQQRQHHQHHGAISFSPPPSFVRSFSYTHTETEA